jgi:hypothetical protein
LTNLKYDVKNKAGLGISISKLNFVQFISEFVTKTPLFLH